MDVELIRIRENILMRSFSEIRDPDFTSAHIKAGRKILKALKRLKERKA
jgi:hypothetical protein